MSLKVYYSVGKQEVYILKGGIEHCRKVCQRRFNFRGKRYRIKKVCTALPNMPYYVVAKLVK